MERAGFVGPISISLRLLFGGLPPIFLENTAVIYTNDRFARFASSAGHTVISACSTSHCDKTRQGLGEVCLSLTGVFFQLSRKLPRMPTSRRDCKRARLAWWNARQSGPLQQLKLPADSGPSPMCAAFPTLAEVSFPRRPSPEVKQNM